MSNYQTSIKTLAGNAPLSFKRGPLAVQQWTVTCPAVNMEPLILTLSWDDSVYLEIKRTGELVAEASDKFTDGQAAVQWATRYINDIYSVTTH